jgi:hypothetical protein
MKKNKYPSDGHFFICEGCGMILDKRNPSCLSHGWIENGKIVCYEKEIKYSSSKRIDEGILYTKNKDVVFLN